METNIGNAFDGVHLLHLIANKDKDRIEAENALNLFTSYFEKKLFKPVEIIASKNGYDENVAFEDSKLPKDILDKMKKQHKPKDDED